MPIGVIGADHSRAPLALRERLALAGERLDALLDALRAEPLLDEAAILSTCHRTEVYVAAADLPGALACVAERLAALQELPLAVFAEVLESRFDTEAARHLFAVAAGLRSLAVGETQIVTQVREAFEHAARCDAAGPELGALARAAVRCGKRVRAETALGTTDTSVSALAVAQASRRLGDLRGRAALLIGAGRINAVSARLLRAAGIGSLVVTSRTPQAAERLAATCDGRAAAMAELPALLAAADVVISATRAPRPLVVPQMIRPRTPERPLLIYDIAVPRDVDAAAGALPGVELVDMDGLRAGQEHGDDHGVAAAWRIVEACVERYIVDVRTQRAVPLIANLRAHVDRQKDAELARTLAGLEHLDPADREAVALLAHRLINRMFHHLATRLKAAAAAPEAEAHLAALAFLFEATDTEYRTVTTPTAELEEGDEPAAGAATNPTRDSAGLSGR